MSSYYSEKLNANKLQLCYEIAPLRIKQFLEAEIEFVLSRISNNDHVLDLGCGYGRVAIRLTEKANHVVGIDISRKNINLAQELYGKIEALEFLEMNAIDMKFPDNCFHVTICIQNGISAFHVDPLSLIKESLRVTKTGGKVLFSSYSNKIWDERLDWFKIQSNHGLIGEIDFDHTKDGVIVCKDGFKALTFSKNEFLELASNFDVISKIHEVDNSSLFCEMEKL
ncbi:MAG: class I SAM-dependent methyltransferase [Bacteroidales bacterium]|nr:class I SAM-dependent methyltransferase [Bacteroidales bacterium]